MTHSGRMQNPTAAELPAIVPPNFGPPEGTDEEIEAWRRDIKATWLGHACFLVELPAPKDSPGTRGVRILYDPVWEHRCSPSQRACSP